MLYECSLSSQSDLFCCSLPPPLNYTTSELWWLSGGYEGILSELLCAGLCDNVHSQQHTYMSSSYRSNRLGLSHWDSYAMHRDGCLELYYCNMVEWLWWDSSLISMTNCFLHCLDTVGLFIWPVKIVPEMTYNVLSGVLSFYPTTALCQFLLELFEQ